MSRPEQAGQSNLTADAGAQMWKTYLEPLHAQNIRLGSPATSSGPSGKIWLQDFLTACAGACTVDFVALRSSTAILNFRSLTEVNPQIGMERMEPSSLSTSRTSTTPFKSLCGLLSGLVRTTFSSINSVRNLI